MKKIKSLVTFLFNVTGSTLILIFVYITDISIVDNFIEYFPEDIAVKLSNESLKNVINASLIMLVVESIIYFFKRPQMDITIKNRDKTEVTNIPIGTVQQSKKLDIKIEINYNWLFLKEALQKLGGFGFKIYNTKWTSIKIENKNEFNRDKKAINDCISKEYVYIDTFKLMGIKETNSKIYLKANIISDITSLRDGTLSASLEPAPNIKKLWKRGLIKFILFVFFSNECCEHKIRSIG